MTTDSITRRQDSTTEQQQSTTTVSQTTPQQTTALSTIVTTSQTSPPPTTTLTTSTQRTTTTTTTTSTTTTTTTAATPVPEIRTTATERDTTTYDVVQVFKSDDNSENSNMIYPQQIPEDRLPPPPPPIHDTEGGLPYFPLPQPPPYSNNNYRPKGKGGRINSIEEERTAMIIGIVAGILIAVILVILLVLWLKSNGDRNYKTAGEKTIYGTHNPNASLLGNTSTNGSYHQQRQQSSTTNHLQTQDARSRSHSGIAMRNNGNAADMCGRSQPMRVERVYHDSTDHSEGEERPGLVKTKKRDSKDVKEWYV